MRRRGWRAVVSAHCCRSELPAVAAAVSVSRRHVLVAATFALAVAWSGVHNVHAFELIMQSLTPVREHAEARIIVASRLVSGTVRAVGVQPEVGDVAGSDLVRSGVSGGDARPSHSDPDPAGRFRYRDRRCRCADGVVTGTAAPHRRDIDPTSWQCRSRPCVARLRRSNRERARRAAGIRSTARRRC